jgi:hypothetical protein
VLFLRDVYHILKIKKNKIFKSSRVLKILNFNNFKSKNLDDEFLLQFLRTKKFSMDETFKVFENYFIFRHEHPKWFSMNQDDEDRINEIIETSIGYTLLKRDSSGSYVAVFNSDCFDLEKYSHKDLFHAVFTSLVTNMEHEENQILGYSCILNFSNTPAKFFTTAPLVDLCNGVKILEKCPGRYKKLVVYGLPSIAVTLFASLLKLKFCI